MAFADVDETSWGGVLDKEGWSEAKGYTSWRKVFENHAKELDVIETVGFPEYFLIVADIVARARRKGTPVVGRGSGASSIVAYLLGSDALDPALLDSSQPEASPWDQELAEEQPFEETADERAETSDATLDVDPSLIVEEDDLMNAPPVDMSEPPPLAPPPNGEPDDGSQR